MDSQAALVLGLFALVFAGVGVAMVVKARALKALPQTTPSTLPPSGRVCVVGVAQPVDGQLVVTESGSEALWVDTFEHWSERIVETDQDGNRTTRTEQRSRRISSDRVPLTLVDDAGGQVIIGPEADMDDWKVTGVGSGSGANRRQAGRGQRSRGGISIGGAGGMIEHAIDVAGQVADRSGRQVRTSQKTLVAGSRLYAIGTVEQGAGGAARLADDVALSASNPVDAAGKQLWGGAILAVGSVAGGIAVAVSAL